jgi:hypothetical protein
MEQTNINQEDIARKIKEALSVVVQKRTEGLENLRATQDVKDNILIREQERLTQKYGSDHLRVQKITKRIAYNQEFVKALDIEIEKAKIEVPEVDPASWMVHGRVLNDQSLGIQNLTVALYDENGKWIRKMSFACTTEQGYFSLIYPPKGTASEISAEQKLFLTVMDKDRKIIHRETEPLYVKSGTVDTLTIFISAKDGTCNPPEPGQEPGSQPGPIIEKTQLTPDAWVVRGKVTDEEKKGIKNLTISLYDKDLIFDDKLGTTLTDESGNFEIIYRTEAFKGLFESNPDIFLKVLDSRGKVLYTSRKEVRPEAGRDEYFIIRIKYKQ